VALRGAKWGFEEHMGSVYISLKGVGLRCKRVS